MADSHSRQQQEFRGQYRHRWENNRGEILYTDENGFDPNRTEEFNTKEWKRSEAWDRRR